MQQIVWNLLSNAVKFTDSGGHIRISLRRTDRSLEVEVVDDGQEISEEFMPLLFERFIQADSSESRIHGGLGIGLPIAEHLAALHGGKITAHSEGIGHGSRFTLELPISDQGRSGGSVESPTPESAGRLIV